MYKKEPKGTENVFSFLVRDKYYRLLKPFFKNPDSKFYVNQLKEITGLSPSIVVAELKNLESEGILSSEKMANAIFYSLNKKSRKTKQAGVIFR